jgi:hypothetical protein
MRILSTWISAASSMGLGESTFRFMSAALSMRSALNRAASPLFMAATISCCT